MSQNIPERIYIRPRVAALLSKREHAEEAEYIRAEAVSNAGPESDPQAPADYQLPPPPTEYTDVAGFARLREEYLKLKEEKDTLAEQYSHACSGINSANRQCESLQSDLKTAQLNASAAVKLAQDREKEVTDFRMLLNEVREERDASLNRITELESERENLSIGREWQRMVKELAEARHRIGELEKELESHAFDLSPAMVQARNDQLNEENETLREGTREWVNLADAAKAERDALKAELANLKAEHQEAIHRNERLRSSNLYADVERLKAELSEMNRRDAIWYTYREKSEAKLESLRTGSAQLAADLDARKRERDEARECARKESDLRHAQVEKLESEARRYRKVIDEQKQQLTEKSALCERLKEVLEAVQSMFDSGPRWVSADHVDVLGEVRFALQRAEGQP